MLEHEIEELMVTTFLGYKYRKQHDLLYSQDAIIPSSLIKMYYSGNVKRLDVNAISKRFVERYVENESFIEGVHDKCEIEGLGVMYDRMHKMSEDEFELFSIIDLHRGLYSKSDNPDYGGKLRNSQAYLKGSQIDLSEPYDIFTDLLNLEDVFNNLKTFAIQMRETQDYSEIKTFVKECLKLKCKLIKIHPFADGNGRTTRCFINKLFEFAGIPPVYINKNEKTEYGTAMNEALRYRSAGEVDDESKYDLITGFYLYKICDSIIELDINDRTRREREEKKFDKKKNKRRR